MSKTQERDSNLFSDLANTTIAGELESRLRELERNIAVARQFIKLADETYTQVRREWEILQEGVRSRKTEKHDLAPIEETETPRTTKTHTSRDTNTKASTSIWKTHADPRTTKTNVPTKEKSEDSSQDTFSTSTPKTPHGRGTKQKTLKTSKEKL